MACAIVVHMWSMYQPIYFLWREKISLAFLPYAAISQNFFSCQFHQNSVLKQTAETLLILIEIKMKRSDPTENQVNPYFHDNIV